MEHIELTVIAFALRYAVNRLSYAPSLVCSYIKKQMPRMTIQQRESFINEVDNYIQYHEYADDIALSDILKLRQDLVDANKADDESWEDKSRAKMEDALWALQTKK